MSSYQPTNVSILWTAFHHLWSNSVVEISGSSYKHPWPYLGISIHQNTVSSLIRCRFSGISKFIVYLFDDIQFFGDMRLQRMPINKLFVFLPQISPFGDAKQQFLGIGAFAFIRQIQHRVEAIAAINHQRRVHRPLYFYLQYRIFLVLIRFVINIPWNHINSMVFFYLCKYNITVSNNLNQKKHTVTSSKIMIMYLFLHKVTLLWNNIELFRLASMVAFWIFHQFRLVTSLIDLLLQCFFMIIRSKYLRVVIRSYSFNTDMDIPSSFSFWNLHRIPAT